MSKKRIALVGNANVGKSVIFGLLTGQYATVSNYPGTTIEVSQGKAFFDKNIIIIDTPGINNLIPDSEDECVTRDILLTESVDFIVQIADAKNLIRALLLNFQIAKTGIPYCLVLNMNDEAKSLGIKTKIDELNKVLGVTVIEVVAIQREGIGNLIKCIKENINQSSSITTTINLTYELLTNQARLNKAKEITHQVQSISPGQDKNTKPISDFIGKITMHPVWGIMILLLVLFLMYEFVGVFGAGTVVGFLENIIFGEYINPFVINLSQKFIPIPLIRDFLTGEYGLITMAFSYGFAIILPIVATFFLAFGLMEDSGYLPRLAVMLNRLFRLVGLNGKAVLPMVLGLGCGTMATMVTRILPSKKERILTTLLLALGVPCSAQLGVIMGLLGSISFNLLFWWLLSILIVMLIVAYFANKVISGSSSDFIMEIPPIRKPEITNILIKTFSRVKWYLKEVIPIFVIGTALLFIIDKIGLLRLLERLFSPVITGLMGLPEATTSAFLIGFFRRDYGAAGLYRLAQQGFLSPAQILVASVTITLFIPCFAQFLMMVKERGYKTALLIVGFILPTAILVGSLVNLMLNIIGRL